jgi:1-deoxy-D-xylulose-5-phosphate synthase
MVDWKKPFSLIEPGKGRMVRDGEEVAILTIGHPGNFAVSACEKLALEGFHPAHFDLRFVKPLDSGLLHEVFRRFKKIITVEDHAIQGGFGSAVAEFMIDNGYQASFNRLGIPDKFIEHGEQKELWAECGFDEASIMNAVRQMAGESVFAVS